MSRTIGLPDPATLPQPTDLNTDPAGTLLSLRAVSGQIRGLLATGQPLFPDPSPVAGTGVLPECSGFVPTGTGQRCAGCRVHRRNHA